MTTTTTTTTSAEEKLVTALCHWEEQNVLIPCTRMARIPNVGGEMRNGSFISGADGLRERNWIVILRRVLGV